MVMFIVTGNFALVNIIYSLFRVLRFLNSLPFWFSCLEIVCRSSVRALLSFERVISRFEVRIVVHHVLGAARFKFLPCFRASLIFPLSLAPEFVVPLNRAVSSR